MECGGPKHTRISMLLFVSLVLLAGCVRAKPPRTVMPGVGFVTGTPVPLAEAEATEVLQELASVTPSTGAYPPPLPSATLEIPTEIPTLTLAPTLTAMPTVPTTSVPASPTATTTATAVPTVEATPSPVGALVHVVAAGETLLSIAQRYDTTTQAILNRNGLYDPNTIYVGQQLSIPVGSTTAEPVATVTVEHIVASGESLSQLARHYRTTVSAIMAQNPAVFDPNNVPAGTKLVVTVGNLPPVVTRIVRRGENLYTIAAQYGVSVHSLVQANGLSNPNRIYVGQLLLIPR